MRLDKEFDSSVRNSLNYLYFPYTQSIISRCYSPYNSPYFDMNNICAPISVITIPSSVKIIGGYAFAEYKSLKEIFIPSSITIIEAFAFYNCTSLTKVTFETPASIQSIDNGAFESCSSLSQITIPSSVKTIKKESFARCTS